MWVASGIRSATMPGEPSTLDTIKTVVETFGALVTALAIIIGGIWAYFKFVKGRTFRPRLEPNALGQWRELDGRHVLQVTVQVKNIGASQVVLLQRGTGLRVSRLAQPQANPAEWRLEWVDGPVFSILTDHDWIEPGETIWDEVAIQLPVDRPEPVALNVRLVWKWHGGSRNIVVGARRILWPPPAIQNREGGDSDEQEGLRTAR